MGVNCSESPFHNGSLSSTWCPIAKMYYEVASPWPLFQCDNRESGSILPMSLSSPNKNNNLPFSHFLDVCHKSKK